MAAANEQADNDAIESRELESEQTRPAGPIVLHRAQLGLRRLAWFARPACAVA